MKNFIICTFHQILL